MANELLAEVLDEKGVLTPEKFSVEVEKRVAAEGKDASYLAHTSAYLEELDIDADDGLSLISATLMDKIKNEALERNLLKEKKSTSSIF